MKRSAADLDTLDDFLDEDGIKEQVTARAEERVRKLVEAQKSKRKTQRKGLRDRPAITSAMISAGVDALLRSEEWSFSREQTAAEVYTAMQAASLAWINLRET